MSHPGNPRTFCRYTATVHFRSGKALSCGNTAPVRLDEVWEVMRETAELVIFERARATTGDDHPVSIDLRVHTFETECTE